MAVVATDSKEVTVVEDIPSKEATAVDTLNKATEGTPSKAVTASR